jgi:hypothetical protein
MKSWAARRRLSMSAFLSTDSTKAYELVIRDLVMATVVVIN